MSAAHASTRGRVFLIAVVKGTGDRDDEEQMEASTTVRLDVPTTAASDPPAADRTHGPESVRVVLGHTSPFLRDGLLLALAPATGIEVVGVARDGRELLELARRLTPDLTLSSAELADASLPGLIVMTSTLDAGRVGELYDAGARCVVPAEVGRERLVGLLHRVAAGERVVLDATQEQLARPEAVVGGRSHSRWEPESADHRHAASNLREGLAVTALARGFVLAMGLVAVPITLGSLPRPALTWALILAMAVWTAVSVAFVRRPPPLPPVAGIAVDLTLSIAFALAVSDVRGAALPFGVLLVAFALRASPAVVGVVSGAGFLAIALLAIEIDPASAPSRIGVFLSVCVVTTMVAVMRQRREHELRALVGARRELLAEALSAEIRARRLVAEELHDDPLQLLLTAQQDLEERDHDPEAVERATALIAEAVARFRGVMLRSSEPDTPGRLGERLEELCARQAARGGYEWTVTVAPGLEPALDELLHALAAELITNVTKHAAADTLTVRVAAEGDGATLKVADDGAGLEPGRLARAATDGHLGIRAVRRRVSAAEGSLTIDSEPGRGTEVRIRLPAPVRR